jgi:hypothetical protein
MLRMNGPYLLMTAQGSQALGLKNVTLLGMFDTFTLGNQPHALPHQFEGLKLADRTGMRPGSTTAVMAATVLLAVPMTFLCYLSVTYRLGAESALIKFANQGAEVYRQVLPNWLNSDVYRLPNVMALSVMAASFLVSCLLLAMRLRCIGTPLHPLGLALANGSSGIGDVVTAVFIASVVKAVILHYGGLQGYRRALPFFLGVMLGDLVMGMGWVAGGIVFDTPTYRFFL